MLKQQLLSTALKLEDTLCPLLNALLGTEDMLYKSSTARGNGQQFACQTCR